MEYNRIISVTGLTGLFELVSSKNDGAIVKGLEDGNTRFVSSRVHQFSHLESIEIYTQEDNVNLVDVFNAMKQSTEALPDVKDSKALISYFQKVFPAMDFERVYGSDMKKMVKWFSLLNGLGIEFKLTEMPAEAETEAVTEAPAEEPAEKPKKKKKAAAEE